MTRWRGIERAERSLAKMPKATKTALGKQGAAVAARKRTGASSPKTRQELYEEAKRRNLKGRSKMGRDELARGVTRGTSWETLPGPSSCGIPQHSRGCVA
jgi:hypothetical protein